MSTALLLARRNLLLYFRDRSGVFMSLLSALILLMIYALFLGGMQERTLQAQIPGAPADAVSAFVTGWVLAGITMITTLTTALSALGQFVEDRATGGFHDFLVSPIRRGSMIVGYLIAAFVISVAMTLFVVIVGQIYVALRGWEVLSLSNAVALLGFILLSSAAFSAFSALLVTFLRSRNAFSTAATLTGTLIGFVAGAYIPFGALSATLASVFSALPFAQSAMLIRGPLTDGSFAEVLAAVPAAGRSEARSTLEATFGMSLSVGDAAVSSLVAVLVIAAVGAVCLVLGALRIGRRIR